MTFNCRIHPLIFILIPHQDTTKYVNALPCDAAVAIDGGMQGWSFRDVPEVGGSSSAGNGTWRTVQVVAPHMSSDSSSDGADYCLDINIQAPLRVTKCNASVGTQVLTYNTITGHLGKVHPMQDGSLYGHLNVGGNVGPNFQFTRSYGVDQCNEEFTITHTGVFTTRCSDGQPHHAMAPVRAL